MILRRSLVFLLGLFVFFFIANSVALGAHSPSFHVIPDKNVAGFVHTVSGKKIVFQYFSWKRASANRLQLWKKLNKPLYLILPGFKLVVCKIKRKLGRPVWEAEIISGSGKLIKPRENLFFSIGDSQKNRALYLQLKRKSRATIVGVQHAVALFKKSKQLRERNSLDLLLKCYSLSIKQHV